MSNNYLTQARKMANSTMVGTGFAMEGTACNKWNPSRSFFKLDLLPGIHNSYVMYELLSEMSWRKVLLRWVSIMFSHRIFRGQLRIFPSGSSNMPLAGWSSITNGVKIIFVRYGVRDPLAGRAWQLLSESVYSSSARWRALLHCWYMIKLNRNFHGKVLIVRPPKLGIR